MHGGFIFLNDDILKGIYEPRIKKDSLEKMSKIFSYIYQDNNIDKKEFDKILIEIDRFRNMIFLEGILQNNQCFINIAYDIDIFICDDNIGILQDVKEKLDEIIESNDNTCKAYHSKVEYNIFDKIKWNNHFIKATNNFKDLNGWNSPKFIKIQG